MKILSTTLHKMKSGWEPAKTIQAVPPILEMEFTTATTAEKIGNISDCPKRNTSEKFCCSRTTRKQFSLRQSDIYILPIKNVAFIKARMAAQPGNKLYSLTKTQA